MVRAQKLLLVCGLLGVGAAGGLAFRRTEPAPVESAFVERAPRRWNDAREAEWQARQGAGSPALAPLGSEGAYASTEELGRAASESASASPPAAAPSDRPQGWLTMRPPTDPPMKVERASPPPIPSRASAPPWTADSSLFERRAELTRLSPLARLDEPGAGALDPDALRPLRRSEDDSPSESTSSLRTVRHRVRDGDTLEGLAMHYLGDRARANDIFLENRHLLSDPQLLPIGTLLAIPTPRAGNGPPLGSPGVRPAASSKLVPLPPRNQRTAQGGAPEHRAD